MKRHRIVRTLALLGGFVAVPIPLLGQNVINVTGIVRGAVKEEFVQDMHFGEMDGLTAAAPDRDIDLLNTTPNAVDGNAGYIDYKLNKDGTSFTLTLPGTLTNGGGVTLAVDNWECGLEVGTGPNTVTDPPGEAQLDAYLANCGAPLVADLSTATGARRVRIFVGGVILATDFQDAVADTYTGQIDIGIIVP